MTTVREAFESMSYGPAPESDKPVKEWLAKHDEKFGHYIGGAWTKSANPFEVSNPATNKRLATVSQGSKKDVDAAVKAARKALPAWQALGGHGRARYLYALARAVQKH